MSKLPKDLTDALKARRVVPFAGAGVSAAVKNRSGKSAFPSWSGLLNACVAYLEAQGLGKHAALVSAYVELGRLLEAARDAQEALGAHWYAFLNDQFDPTFATIDDATLALARAVWSVSNHLVITTNYDKVLHWSCPEPRDLQLWTSADRANLARIQSGDIDKPTVWHLHGFIGKPEDLILTPDGYQRLYPKNGELEGHYEAALSTLRSLLTTRVLLFVGFGMEAALQDQVRWVRDVFASGGATHYLLAKVADRERFEQALKGLSVRVVPYANHGAPLLELLQELRDCMSAGTAEAESSPREPPHRDQMRELQKEPSQYQDRLLDRVEAIYRAKNCQVERKTGPTLIGEYLRVIDPAGVCFPAAAGTPSAPSIQQFRDAVVSDYRSADPATPALFIYPSESEPDEALRIAAQSLRVPLVSFVSLQGLIDFSPYRKRLRDRLNDPRYVPDSFVPQKLTYRLGRQPMAEENALDAVWKWISHPAGSFVVILGNFGSGKSFLLREISRRFLDEGLITPILIDLRLLNRAQNVDSLLATHLAQEAFEEFNLRAFRYMAAEGRLALLFDGYDELELRVGYEQAAQHFETICAAAGSRARIAVTSRTQHFKSDQQLEGALSALGQKAEVVGARIATIEPFDEPRKREFLVRKFGDEQEADRRLQLLDRVRDLPSLAENPRMLGFIAEIDPAKLESAARHGKRISEASLYGELLDWWLAKEEERANPPGEKKGLTKDALWSAVETLALKLWRDGVDDVGVDDLSQAAAELRALGKTALDIDVAAQQAGSATLLVREGERFRFLHFSIVEWLVARYASRDLNSNRSVFETREISPLMARFLLGLCDGALQCAGEMISAPTGSTAAKQNALLIRQEASRLSGHEVKRRQPANLCGQDLRGRDFTGQDMRDADLHESNLEGVLAAGANLAGANLRNARLAGADLTSAHLAGADLSGADLCFAKLNGADLTSVSWTEETNFAGAQMLGLRGIDQVLQSHALSLGAGVDGGSPQPSVLPSTMGAAIAIDPAGRFIAVAAGNGIVIWETAGGRAVRTLEGHERGVQSVAFDPQGRWLASGSEDKTVRLWETAGGRAVRTLEGHTSGVLSVAFDPQGRWLASGSYDGTVRLCETAGGRAVRTLEGHMGSVQSVAFDPRGRWLASGSYDGTVRLWETAGGRAVRTLEGHTSWVLSVAFDPQGRWLASGSEDKTVRLWETASGRSVRTLKGHTSLVLSVAFDPQGRWLASGSYDGTVRLWETASGRSVRTLEGHTSGVQSVAFDPQGRWLASGSYDGTIRFWELETGKCLGILFATPEGWAAFRPDGSYRSQGDLQQKFWHAINLARFELGDLDRYFPQLALPEDELLLPQTKPTEPNSP